MDKPRPRELPPEYSPSFAELGIIAQKGCLIELRAPDPSDPKGHWPRMWLTQRAAKALLEWLPRAIEEQEEAFVVPSSSKENS